MAHFFLIFLFFLVPFNSSFADCTMQNDRVAVKYQLTSIQLSDKSQKNRHFILWRNGHRQVAHQYPDTHVTDVWERTSNDHLRLVRYFDNHQRGIEYQPDEIGMSRGKSDWSLKSQLISNKSIKGMELQTTQGEGCDKIETYSLKNDKKIITLE